MSSAATRSSSNGGLGIDLGNDGVTPNSPGGPHSGPNHFQNYPILTVVNPSASGTTISGALNSTPSTTFTIQFFASALATSGGNDEGQHYLRQRPR